MVMTDWSQWTERFTESMQSETWREQNWKIRTVNLGPMRQYQKTFILSEFQGRICPQGDKVWCRKTAWRSNIWKYPKFGRKQTYRFKRLVNSKQDKLKEFHTQAQHDQTSTNWRQRKKIFKEARKTVIYKGTAMQMAVGFSSETTEDQFLMQFSNV